MEFMDAVRQRRSVRRFLPRPIPEAVLTDILDAARYAPSSGGYNSSYFGVIRDESTRVALAAVSGGQDWIATAPVVIALCSRLSPDPATRAADDQYFEINAARFGKEIIGYLNAFPDRQAMRVFSDTAFPMIPGEHVALAATAHGLASCWIGHLDTARASQILGLPEDVVCL
jgi:nitroreductase